MVFRVIMNQNFVMIFIILIFLIHILPEIKKVQFQQSDRKYTRMYWKKKNEKRSKGNNKGTKFIVYACVNTYTCI